MEKQVKKKTVSRCKYHVLEIQMIRNEKMKGRYYENKNEILQACGNFR